MNHLETFNKLRNNYKLLNPHHDTWELWIKDNKSVEEFFEVAIGTILVQNTNWVNVDKAVDNLRKKNFFSFEKIYSCNDDKLKTLIRPAGFFSQKSVYLKAISKIFLDLDYTEITRDLLLKTKGIGKETADSLLNFCLRRPLPVIGTYTKRFFARLYGDSKYLAKKYEFIQDEILESFDKPTAYDLGLFHALIVSHSQNVCTKKKPTCDACFIKNKCSYSISRIGNTPIHSLIDEQINPVKKRDRKKNTPTKVHNNTKN